MNLRPYQREAVNLSVDRIKKRLEPFVLELATGAGKSIIIAEIAKQVKELSGKNILNLCPNKELVEQNREKYLRTGYPASLFSASAGIKCLKHNVVFGTPMSVKNSIDKFGKNFSLIILDECHLITPTVKTIIEHFKSVNPKIRVMGLTATPFRLGTGYIYAKNDKNIDVEAREPYFERLLYKIGARTLIDRGYLANPTIGAIGASSYETLHLQTNNMGKFNSSEIDRAFVGMGRKTSQIVEDVVIQCRNREGILLFASTIKHAYEILESLPKELSAIVTGETPKSEREAIIKKLRAKKIKYVVNVAVFTTGFDVEHIDVIALLRATESVSLLQQIIGRGLRLSENKKDCLILDYAQNLDRHCPDGDIFNPKITTKKKSEKVDYIQPCPLCGFENMFGLRENKDGYEIDEEGYFTDLNGIRIITDSEQPLPAHYGRRCKGSTFVNNDWQQCNHRWSLKICENCNTENDITARYCTKCKNELVDPNEKLVFEFKQLKKDPTQIQIDEVVNFSYKPTLSKAGNTCIRVDFTTPFRSFSVWLQKEPKNQKAYHDLVLFEKHKEDIKTVEYKKESNGFYRVLSYNKEIQKCIVNT